MWAAGAVGGVAILVALYAFHEGSRGLAELLWGTYPMTYLAAAAVFLLCLAVTLIALRSASSLSPRRRTWTPFLAVAVTVTATLSLWHMMAIDRRERLTELLNTEAAHVSRNLANEITLRILRFPRYALTAPFLDEERIDEREPWAAAFMAKNPGYVSISWHDRDCAPLWSARLDGYAHPTELEEDGVCAEVLRQTATQGLATLGSDAIPNVPDFQVYVPLLPGAASAGFAVATIDKHLLVHTALEADRTASAFSVAVFEGDNALFRNFNPRDSVSWLRESLSREYAASFFELETRVEMWPTRRWITENHSAVPEVTLLFGLLLAVMVGASLQLRQKAQERAKEIVRLSAHRRRAEEERDRLFTMSTDLLCIVDMEGRFNQLNPAWKHTLGYSLGELKSRPFMEFVHPDDRPATLAEFAKVKNGQPTLVFENRYRCRDGSYRWLLWASRTSRRTGLIYAAAKDITGRKQDEEKLEATSRQLQSNNEELTLALAAAQDATEMKSRFVAAMSHEIRTPMSGILGMNELMLCTSLNEEQREYAEAIKDSTEALLHIVNDILDLSKIEAGKLGLEQFPFDLRLILQASVTLLLPQAHAKGITLKYAVSPEIPDRLVGDAGRVRQILVNLIGNAVKFTDEGRVSITADAIENRSLLRLTVVDEGIGIPPHRLGQIFNDFTQVDETTARRFGGTGLGLSISKRLVEMMGGKIGCESTPGKGSSFWFTVPLVESGSPSSGESSAAEGNAPPCIGKRRILVVEDNKVNQTVAIRLLEKERCLVDAVDNGEAALDRLTDQSYDLILMDVNMPGMDGLEVTSRIRECEDGNHRTPIVAMTARAMDGDREQCLAAGMDDYLSKPISADALLSLLSRWAPSSRTTHNI
jgi:PAS domain S-box-containing protein